MHTVLCKLISKKKGEPFHVDANIPLSYLLRTVLEWFAMFVRGAFVLAHKRGALFKGRNVTIRAAGKMRIGKNVSIGHNCYIDAMSVDGIAFGDNVSIQKYTTIECTGSVRFIGKGLIIGNSVGIGSHSFLGCAGGVEIGDDTITGNFVSFHSENHNSSGPGIPIRLQGVSRKGIKVGKNCWIGAKATILDGAVIGDGCIIAANSVVAQGVYKSDAIYGGAPARFIKNRL